MDSTNLKDGLEFFSCVWSKMLSVSQTLRLVNLSLSIATVSICYFVACWHGTKEDKSWFESFQFGKVKYAPSQSDYIILESTLS